jgi:RimJ/RimL family protein N-acetyltransferase
VQEDLEVFASINADPLVMDHFPKLLSEEETKAYMVRLYKHGQKWGYTYFAVDRLDSSELIGFIGLAYKDYPAVFNPSVDIGWRLKPAAWGQGFATEGALRCLEFAFKEAGLDRIVSTCTTSNTKSEAVMRKIGMRYKGHFDHPNLKDYPEMQECLWYEIRKEEFETQKHP